jgi:hypothetical protein
MKILVTDGTLRVVGDTYMLATHRVAPTERQMAIRTTILAACERSLFTPPRDAELERELPFPPREAAPVYEARLLSGDMADGGICGLHAACLCPEF